VLGVFLSTAIEFTPSKPSQVLMRVQLAPSFVEWNTPSPEAA
jgi:hypothetical protein